MIGTFIVIIWLLIFSIVSHFLCVYLDLKSVLIKTIFIWTFFMCFVALFEMMLIFNHTYLSEKGTYYYENNMCHWTEDNSILDAFSSKLYMDLYADYSLCDKRYSNRLDKDNGCRFVLLGEIIHGLFCIIMCTIIMFFYFFNFNELYIYISAIIFSGIQFAMIIWYLSTIFMEMAFVKNEQFWWFPLLWNVPWIILPLYITYYGVKEIVNIKTVFTSIIGDPVLP